MTTDNRSARARAAWQAALVALGVATATPLASQARLPQNPETGGDLILDAGGAPIGDLNLTELRRRGGFQLFGAADAAGAGGHGTGNFGYAIDNYGPCDAPLSGFCAFYVHEAENPGGAQFSFFEILYFAGAPPSARQAIVDAGATSVLNSTGGGYSTVMNFALFAGRAEWGPRDNTLASLFAGVPSTDDGSCLDNTGFSNGFFPVGLPVLALSNCEATWPGGVWGGDRLIEQSGYEQHLAADPANFSFDYWSVPDAFKSSKSPFMGNQFSTYGESSDHYQQILEAYGSVIPGGTEPPGFQGYPLGLVWRFEMFNFGLPALSGVQFVRYSVINRSEDVYNVPVDYDSLYLGFAPGTGGAGQAYSNYYIPEIGTALYHQSGSSAPTDYCQQGARTPSGVSGCDGDGYDDGGTAIIVLKSPIGDLRNKLFTRDVTGVTCTPGDPNTPFCDPTHPQAGDTITFNHGHMCGFGGCWANTHNVNDRRSFGMISSTEANALDGRDPATLSGSEPWRTYRNFGYPAVQGVFNRWVPGSSGPPAAMWDWNKDGVPDTLFFDSCHTDGCVTPDADTMPGGQINSYGNVGGVLSAGPIALAAGDTVSWFVAFVGEQDSTRTWSAIGEAINAYLTFFLLPEAPPPPAIASTQVTAASDFDLRANAAVSLFFDDAAERWVDPFLASKAATEPNPTLAAQIAARASDNLAAIEIYKSCDGGNTFTSDGDCDGDPATNVEGGPVGFGWEAYSVLDRDALGGDIPNVFTDGAVQGGRTYLYVLVARSRGATFLTTVSGLPDTVQIAPPISNALSRSTSDVNVVSVYIPASRQAGALPATATFSELGLGATVPFELLFTDAVTAGTYTAQFGNRIIVERDSSIAQEAATETRVTLESEVAADVAGVETDTVVQRTGFVRSGVAVFPVAGAPDATVTAVNGDTVTVTDTYNALGFVAAGGSTPFFASVTLTGGAATPTGVFALPDFPGFTINADNDEAGEFNSNEVAIYGAAAAARLGVQEGDTIPRGNIVGPSLPQWREQSSSAGPTGIGVYELTWTDEAFGLPNGIVPDFGNPGATEAEFVAALRARTTGTTGLVDAQTAAVTGQAQGDLVAVRVPFTVRNATFDRPVSVAMVRRVGGTYLLGTGTDTVRVNIPDDEWVPGDALLFIEDVVEDSTTANGVVLGAGGTPIQVTHRNVTFTAAVVGCESPREACNPVAAGQPGNSAFLPTFPGDRIRFEYYSGFEPGSRYTWDLTEPVTGDSIAAVTDSSLAGIRVVPNPYVVFSEYQTSAAEGMVLFTNMPPTGTVRIYTVSGQFVQQIDWTSADLLGNGDLFYDLKSREGIDIATGLYIWVVTAPSDPTNPASAPVTKSGKFVVIRGTAR